MQTVLDPEVNTTRATWRDRLVGARDSFLDWITGTRSSSGFNPEDQHLSRIRGRNLPARMREALDRIKAEAMDAQGVHVDYAALRAHPDYLEFRSKLSPALRSFDPASLTTDAEQMAFWINLYHVLVLDAVISLRVNRSVAEGWLGFMAFFRKAAYNVGGHRLNCASRSCPPIQIYSAKTLDAQLDLATRSFVDANVVLDPARRVLVVSNLFRWYASDFGGREGVVSLLIDHLPFDERRAWLSAYGDDLCLRYAPYDWSLNDSL